MSPDTIFLIANYGVIPAWALLILAPGWSGTQRILHAIWIPLLLGTLYGWMLVTFPAAPEGGGFGSLDAVMKLFTVPQGVLVGWIHYLVFDLFIGAWELRDSRRRGIHHAWMVPCLFFTMMLGPLGLMGYLCVRFALTRVTDLEEVTV